jgi:hypothetical protein
MFGLRNVLELMNRDVRRTSQSPAADRGRIARTNLLQQAVVHPVCAVLGFIVTQRERKKKLTGLGNPLRKDRWVRGQVESVEVRLRRLGRHCDAQMEVNIGDL